MKKMSVRDRYFNIFKDGYSNKVAGCEDDNIYESTSGEPAEVADEFEEELLTQEDNGDEEIDYDDDSNYMDEFNGYGDDEGDDDFTDFEQDPDYKPLSEEGQATIKRPEDCVNIIEVISSFLNNYRENMAGLKNLYTYDEFESSKWYEITESITDVLNKAFLSNTNNIIDKIFEARELLTNSRKMEFIKGNGKAPYIYEGMQIAYIMQCHVCLLGCHYQIQSNKPFEEIIKEKELEEIINFLNGTLTLFVDNKDNYGTKINFQEDPESILGDGSKSNRINETVYADSDIINGKEDLVDGITYANESVNLFLDLKNNKVLVPVTDIIRKLSLLTEIAKEFPAEDYNTIRESIVKAFSSNDDSKLAQMISDNNQKLEKVLIDISNAMKNIQNTTDLYQD